MPRPKPMPVPKFGAQLARLRGERSLADVCRDLAAYGIRMSRTKLLYYEQGRVSAPDPIVLWALGRVYQQESVDDMLTILAMERTGRSVRGGVELQLPKYTQAQVQVAEWFGSFDPMIQQALMALMRAVAVGDIAAARGLDTIRAARKGNGGVAKHRLFAS